ncbi:photosynthetic complex putative assembly protein PuhB [Qipengyuania sp. ASV99]|uniref:photosynthetic complex putative assembly protein PuhB n=1 Tax=Qipengyuania sp. ASV99 TaxID=3399681 RepID=UPI003A4C60B0
MQPETLQGDAMGPSAEGDPMGTPAPDERVLWKGRPNLSLLSRTAFHSGKVGMYFAALIAVSAAFGNLDVAAVCAVLGVTAAGILHGLAWLSVRSTLYILTDTRLILRIGMAIETRINVPLKHVTSANLKKRGGGHGDIALELVGERLLGYFLLWPHVRPWRYAHPQPMLRAVPEAESVAALLADACAAHTAIERNLTEINVPAPASVHKAAASDGQRAMPNNGPRQNAMKGATA